MIGPNDLLDITTHTRRESMFRDWETGKHYVSERAHGPLDHEVAWRVMTITERRWLGEHPDAISLAAGAFGHVISLTVEIEYGDWRNA